MPKRIISLAVLLVCVAALEASAQTLTVGDPAPPLAISRFVKGEKIDRLEPGKTYVVEFWATWCGPCRVSIPHLTELQKKYKDKDVTFIGVSVWEQDQEKVEPFVRQMGDKMDYNVALDDVPRGEKGAKGKMAESWMEAADEHGIPTAFIVTDTKIAWIGHPMRLDRPLADVVSDRFDIASAASKYREEKAEERKLMTVLEKVGPLLRTGKTKDAIAALDQAFADDPKLEHRLGMIKYNLMLQGDDEEAASAYGNTLVEGACKDDADSLNAIAWAIVGPQGKRDASKRDVKLALKAAQRANELTHGENAAILDTLAKATFDSGDPRRALELQEKAIKLAGGDDQGMKDRLEEYQKAVKEKDQ